MSRQHQLIKPTVLVVDEKDFFEKSVSQSKEIYGCLGSVCRVGSEG